MKSNNRALWELFELFLKKNKAHKRFHENYKMKRLSIEDYRGFVRAKMWLRSAFVWDSTPQGEDYWSELNQKWFKWLVAHNF